MERLSAKCLKREFIDINFLENLEELLRLIVKSTQKEKNASFEEKIFLAILYLIIQA